MHAWSEANAMHCLKYPISPGMNYVIQAGYASFLT